MRLILRAAIEVGGVEFGSLAMFCYLFFPSRKLRANAVCEGCRSVSYKWIGLDGLDGLQVG